MSGDLIEEYRETVYPTRGPWHADLWFVRQVDGGPVSVMRTWSHRGEFVTPRSEDILSAGEVVTIEPGVYLPGELGVRIEDLVVVADGGCRNLSGLPKELQLVE